MVIPSFFFVIIILTIFVFDYNYVHNYNIKNKPLFNFKLIVLFYPKQIFFGLK